MSNDDIIKRINEECKHEKYMFTQIMSNKNILPGNYEPEELCKKPWAYIIRNIEAMVSTDKSGQNNSELYAIRVPNAIHYIASSFARADFYSLDNQNYYCKRDEENRYYCDFRVRTEREMEYNIAAQVFLYKQLHKEDMTSLLCNFVHLGRWFRPFDQRANELFFAPKGQKFVWNPTDRRKNELNNGWTVGGYNIAPGVVKIYIPTDNANACALDEKLVSQSMAWAAVIEFVPKLKDEYKALAQRCNIPFYEPFGKKR